MKEPIQNIITQSLETAQNMYYRLVLLVGKSGSGKTVTLRDFSNKFNIPFININLELSKMLLELTKKQRILNLQKLLEQIITTDSSTVILDNLEILFERELKQNPLYILQKFSRNRSIIASWNGSVVKKKLIYAQIGHPEYRSYDVADTLIVEMNDSELKTTKEQ